MDDRYDLVGFFLDKDGLLRSGIIGLLEGTPLESSAGSLSFAVATFAVVNIVFLMLFFSQFAILWIERKAVARQGAVSARPRYTRFRKSSQPGTSRNCLLVRGLPCRSK